jgi:putative ABC transport system substrate-binding protein
LIAAQVEVIVTAGTPASLAVKKAASIPLVMVAVGDPVATGLVTNLARPGGNVTGLTSFVSVMEGKRLELLREVVPNISHIAVLWNPASPIQVVLEKEAQDAAAVLGIRVLSLGVRTQEELEAALSQVATSTTSAPGRSASGS